MRVCAGILFIIVVAFPIIGSLGGNEIHDSRDVVHNRVGSVVHTIIHPDSEIFFGLAKVLDVAFGNHLGIMLMMPMVDNVEKERLCHTVNLDFIIAHIKLLLLRNVSLEHGREHSAYTRRPALSGGNRLLSSDVNGFCGLGFIRTQLFNPQILLNAYFADALLQFSGRILDGDSPCITHDENNFCVQS